ncbi:MAG: hypothetical protein M5U25_20905 [Planctomycetota bacterium]|nr:hypothetical protein [Planctomycetota bacterium]
MGYTHYWSRPKRALDARRFMRFVEDVRKLLAVLPERSSSAGGHYADEPLRIAGWDGEGEPDLLVGHVAFNGVGEMSHETFRVDHVLRDVMPFKGRYAECCKTNRKPYDLLVCAALMALKRHFPEVRVLSDGTREDWAEARMFYERVLGQAPGEGPWETAEDKLARMAVAAGGVQ